MEKLHLEISKIFWGIEFHILNKNSKTLNISSKYVTLVRVIFLLVINNSFGFFSQKYRLPPKKSSLF